MKNKLIDTKIIILIIVAIILIGGMFYFMNKQKSVITEDSLDVSIVDAKISKLEKQSLGIDKLLKDTKELLNPNASFLFKLNKQYINFPETEEEINRFIGTVENKYPFGDPIRDKNFQKK